MYRLEVSPAADRDLDRLKQRLAKLLSQPRLAKLSGVSRNTIVAIENDQHKPQLLTIHKLAKALDVDPKKIELGNG